jgi:hypothetical protein
MLDQSFSTKNFNIIFEIENRKGVLNKKLFSEAYYEKAQELIDKRREIKDYPIKNIEDEGYKNLLDGKILLIKEKEQILIDDLQNSCDIVNSSNFSFKITPFKNDPSDPDEKFKYSIVRNDATSFFAMKQLQHNLNRSFNVKQSNRYLLVEQIKCLLQDNLPKYIVRTDIEGFYENVPQQKLLQLIEENQLLSPKSKKLIINLLYHFNSHTGQLAIESSKRKGIPRGAGASAYLAELYMKSIDRNIRNIENLTFYGRYVDDMFAVFSPLVKVDQDYFLNKIEKIVKEKDLSLKRNPDPSVNKTYECNLYNDPKEWKIKFLGYEFVINDKRFVDVYLSQNKFDSYERKINSSLIGFLKESKFNYKLARKLLIHRLNYLTKNTKLEHPKRGLIGIFYSNSLLEKDSPSLDKLNDILIHSIDKHIPVSSFSKLNERLKRFDFKKGFNNKLFYNISAKANPKTKCKKGHKDIPDLRSANDKLRRRYNNFDRIVSSWK